MKKASVRILSALLAICVFATPAFAASVNIEDVSEDNWAYPYASYMVKNDIMPLKYEAYFDPAVFTTRGEFVLYLWRAAGSPDIFVAAPTFDDVDIYDGYYDAVEWAVHHDITTGTSETEFSPHLLLTREQAFTFLWRALPFFNFSTEGLTGRYINGFEDAGDVSQWAWQPMNELCALGIVNGDGGYLMPLRDVANSETAAILYRTLELVDALVDEDEYISEFYIYNMSDFAITCIHVMPAYSDGDGVDILPFEINPGESYLAQFTEDFIYAGSDEWRMIVTDEFGDVYSIDEVFYPQSLAYFDIHYDYMQDAYFCDFVY